MNLKLAQKYSGINSEEVFQEKISPQIFWTLDLSFC